MVALVFDDDVVFSCWVFSCLFESGGVSRIVVYAACEYDAWVSFEVLSGIVPGEWL